MKRIIVVVLAAILAGTVPASARPLRDIESTHMRADSPCPTLRQVGSASLGVAKTALADARGDARKAVALYRERNPLAVERMIPDDACRDRLYVQALRVLYQAGISAGGGLSDDLRGAWDSPSPGPEHPCGCEFSVRAVDEKNDKPAGPDLIVDINGRCCTGKQLQNAAIALGGLVVSGAAAIAASGAPGPVKGVAATIAKIGGIVMSAITAARAGNDALNGDGDRNGGREPGAQR